MSYEVNFGTIRLGNSRPASRKTGSFRIALMGDFSARANSGKLETGAALGDRKPLKVDCDNVDGVVKRLGIRLRLPLGAEGAAVELAVNSMDDLHPDQLYSNLSIFSELSGLRQRLKTPSTFAKAAKEVQSWAGVRLPRPPRTRPRGGAIPASGKLSDFARLIGAPTVSPKTASPLDELLKRAVGPHVVKAKDPRQDQLVAAVDSALATTMRLVLHHPDFQCVEALWRSVDLLVRRLETDEHLQVVLYDVTAEELAADLSQADSLEESGLYKLLIEQPAQDAAQGPLAVVIGNYLFEETPPHAELLGRIARIVAQSQSAFIAGVGTSCLDTKVADLHPLVREAWNALAQMPEAAYLGLTAPRFMLRMPYGKKTDPIESFDFDEFTAQAGLSGMLWGNAAVIGGLLLGATFSKQGAKMQPGSVLTLGDMPFYYYTDSDGDQTALPCTERLLSSRMAELVSQHRFMPLLSMKGRPEVRLAGFGSLAGSVLAGPWRPVTGSSAPTTKAAPVVEPVEEEQAPEPSPAEEAASPAETETPAEAQPAEPAADTSQPAEENLASEHVDPELEKLLAEFKEEPAPAKAAADENAEPEIDPELAKLLKELG